MIATRRLHSNEHCAAFAKSFLIFEALRVGYSRTSDRLHCFVLDGMAENALTCQSRGVRYYPDVGPFSQDWIARHSACGPGRFFRDVRVSGPFPGWEHTHKFLPDAATSSWLEDIVEYDLPLGWLGKLLAAAYTRRRLQRLFAWHHKITGEQHAERSRKGAF